VPRRPREEAAGSIHHVVPKGSAGESLVRDNRDREALVKQIDFATQRYRWSCFAYCLLDTHFHLVVATPMVNLGRGMQWLLSGASTIGVAVRPEFLDVAGVLRRIDDDPDRGRLRLQLAAEQTLERDRSAAGVRRGV